MRQVHYMIWRSMSKVTGGHISLISNKMGLSCTYIWYQKQFLLASWNDFLLVVHSANDCNQYLTICFSNTQYTNQCASLSNNPTASPVYEEKKQFNGCEDVLQEFMASWHCMEMTVAKSGWRPYNLEQLSSGVPPLSGLIFELSRNFMLSIIVFPG